MPRFARLAVLLALAATLTWPTAAIAAPNDAPEAGVVAAARDWLAWLWEPVARLLGSAEGGPGMHPGVAGGPTMDPNGVAGASATPPAPTQGSPTNGNETDGGPTMDPDG